MDDYIAVSVETLIEQIFRQTYKVDAKELMYKAALIDEIKDSIRRLRAAYKQNVCENLYDEEAVRKAYMIAYYPYYVEPAYRVVKEFVAPELEYRSTLNVIFLAGGPCPELYACARAFSEEKICDKINAAIFDAEAGWCEYQEITVALCQNLLPIAKKFYYGANFEDDFPFAPNSIKEIPDIIENADVIFMQNYLSHVDDTDRFLDWFSDFAELVKDDAFMVFIDLNYDQTDEIFGEICDSCEDNNFSLIDFHIPPAEPKTVNSWKVPYPVWKNIYDKDDDLLKPKANTNFYYVVLQKY